MRRAARVAILVAAIGCRDQTAPTQGDVAPIYTGVFVGTAAGSSNGVAFSNAPVRISIQNPPGNGFNGTWTSGPSSGTISGVYRSPVYNVVYFAITQTAPCAGQLSGYGEATISSDGQVTSVDVSYGGLVCPGTPNAQTVYANAALTLQ